MAFIMGMSEGTIISKWEQMRRKANSIVILTYHLVFDIPLESPYKEQAGDLARFSAERIALRVQELKALAPDPRVRHRVSFLESVVARLNGQGA